MINYDFLTGDSTYMEDENLLHYVWLSLALGAGSQNADTILSAFESPKDLYNFGKSSGFENIKFLTSHEISKLKSVTLHDAENIVSICKKNNYQILTYNDKKYPAKLRNIYSSPIVLYISGVLPDTDNLLSISIVGSRKNSKYGEDVTTIFSSTLANCNIIIISGMAVGIDSIAMKSALDAKGKVIGVVGCGLDIKYPISNLDLRKDIETCSNGCIISEYPPGVKPIPSNFPIRNRIISGLSTGVIVVEADTGSGALITAKLAADQGKDVYGIPNHIFANNSRGVLELLKEGATMITHPIDIINSYKWSYKNNHDFLTAKNNIKIDLQNNSFDYSDYTYIKEKIKIKPEIKTDVVQEDLKNNLNADLSSFTEQTKNIYHTLEEKPIHIDTLVQKLNYSMSDIMVSLTELEIYGLVLSHPGARYSIS
jgi:DNA processing protein